MSISTPPAATVSLEAARPRIRVSAHWAELLTVLAICCLVGWLCLHQIQASRLTTFFSFDTYFDADCSRNAATMVSRNVDQIRSSVHPLLPLMTSVPISAARRLLHLKLIDALSVYMALTAMGWSAVLYALLRIFGCFRTDAAVFTLLALSSASAIHWVVVPESYTLGSITIILGLLLPRIPWRHRDRGWWLAISSAVTMFATVTNWMVGIVVAFSGNRWRRAAKITMAALLIVSILWLLQRALVPSSDFFLAVNGESTFLQPLNPQRLLNCIRVVFLYVMLMPEVTTHPIWPFHGAEGLSIQSSPLPFGDGLVVMGSITWIALMMIGARALLKNPKCKAFRVPIVGSLIGQFGLHLVYGQETFLYSLHFLPLLVLIVAAGTFTRFRTGVLTFSLLLAVFAVTHNSNQFDRSIRRLPELDARRSAIMTRLPPTDSGGQQAR